jgi:NAD(P)-dependent dehydrogenase (short-subunit alcohol dehydrogenase family)
MDEFVGKVVLITGAGRGLGQEVALAFASLGAAVAANDINPLSLDETVDHIRQAGGEASSHVFDVAKRMPIEAMVSQVLDHYGHIDILVNHAKVEPDEFLLEMDEWEFHRTLDVNLGGPFFTMQQVGRIMRQQGAGIIVNLISFPERVDSIKGHSAHTASQAGLIGLTQAAAGELSVYNIRVNAICNGPVDIGLVPSPTLNAMSFHRWMEAHPEVKKGEQGSVVSLVLFLCSQAASALSGQILSPEVGR